VGEKDITGIPMLYAIKFLTLEQKVYNIIIPKTIYMEQYVIIALISMFFFGTNAIIQKSAKNIDPITLTLVALVTATTLTLIYWLFFAPNKEHSIQGISFGILSGVAFAIAFITFIIALKMGKASVVVTINALSAGVAVILAVTLLAEKLTLLKIGGIVLGIIAAILLAL